MRFHHFDCLKTFTVAARHLSFSRAAEELNLTKGAISYQVGQLEKSLGFDVFIRRHRAIELTDRGRALWQTSHDAFRDIEQEIASLREDRNNRISIGMTSYFASRWLSPRLMTFISNYPDISLRLQPLLDMSDIKRDELDMVIRWGNGHWNDLQIERLFLCPVFPTADSRSMKRVKKNGLANELKRMTLLQDDEKSLAWSEWHRSAGLPYRAIKSTLVVRDPNVRVQSTVHGQGAALNDNLVERELKDGELHRISDVSLNDYGYFLAYPKGTLAKPALKLFRDWLHDEAVTYVNTTR